MDFQALNVDLCERIAAQSHALTISAEKQGEQAQEITRLRKIAHELLQRFVQVAEIPESGEWVELKKREIG